MSRSPLTKSFFKFSITILTVAFWGLTSCNNDDSQPKGAQITISDENFEAALVDQGLDTDGEVNGLIYQSDAENVTFLDLNINANLGRIESLNGIEAFINITYLSAHSYELTSVDLSQNTKLTTLILYNNSITQIDLSPNTALTSVDIHANELTSIAGIENMTSLSILDLSMNNLTSSTIDNASVETVYLNQNLLNSVDVDGASNLKTLIITTNQLQSINLSSNTLLESLIISDNQIEEIDITQNSALAYFYMSSNALNTLDVSNNTALVDLRVDRNPSLTCIKIADGQSIPSTNLSDYQELNTNCQ